MISCPVCGTGNRELAVICTGCHGFLQSRAAALDLFSTGWAVIETPGKAFRRIALATHKNFGVLLSCLFGILWVFGSMRALHLGDLVPNLFLLILVGLVLGPPVGLALMLMVAAPVVWIGRWMGGEGTYRNAFGVIAYCTLPLTISLFFVLPVELGVFGLSFFGTNPSAAILKPTIFLVLMIVQCGLLIWFLVLLIIGSGVVHDISKWKSTVVALAVACAMFGSAYLPVLVLP